MAPRPLFEALWIDFAAGWRAGTRLARSPARFRPRLPPPAPTSSRRGRVRAETRIRIERAGLLKGNDRPQAGVNRQMRLKAGKQTAGPKQEDGSILARQALSRGSGLPDSYATTAAESPKRSERRKLPLHVGLGPPERPRTPTEDRPVGWRAPQDRGRRLPGNTRVSQTIRP